MNTGRDMADRKKGVNKENGTSFKKHVASTAQRILLRKPKVHIGIFVMSSAVITSLESSSSMPVQQLRDENNSIPSLEQIKSINDSVVLEMPSSMIYPGLNEALTNSGM